MRNLLSTRLAASAVCCVSVLAATPTAARAELIYGITASRLGGPQTLVRFDSATPDAVTTVATLTGMPAGHFANGMDFRPATGQLYVGASGPSDFGGFAAQPYTVNLSTGAMTPVGTPFDPLEMGAGVPSFDFDPVRDEMRVLTTPTDKPPVTNTRYDPDTFVLISVDTALGFDPNGPGAAFNPPFAIGAAYSNNVAGAASTRSTPTNWGLTSSSRSAESTATPAPTAGRCSSSADRISSFPATSTSGSTSAAPREWPTSARSSRGCWECACSP